MSHITIAIAQKDEEADFASERVARLAKTLNATVQASSDRLERVVKNMVGLTHEGRKSG